MPTCLLVYFPRSPSALQELCSGGRRKKELGLRVGDSSTIFKVVLSPRYPGASLHAAAVSCPPRKHPSPTSESFICPPSDASSKFSG